MLHKYFSSSTGENAGSLSDHSELDASGSLCRGRGCSGGLEQLEAEGSELGVGPFGYPATLNFIGIFTDPNK